MICYYWILTCTLLAAVIGKNYELKNMRPLSLTATKHLSFMWQIILISGWKLQHNKICTKQSSLIHWDRVALAVISKMAFWNSLYWIKPFCISIHNSLRFVPRDSVSNLPALVQILAKALGHYLNQRWLNLLMHICVTRSDYLCPNVYSW